MWVRKPRSSTLLLLLLVIGWLGLSLVWPAVTQKRPSSPAAKTSATVGENDNQSQDPDANTPPTAAELSAPTAGGKLILSQYEFWLSAEVLIFGFAVLIAEFLLLRKAKINAEEALRVYAVSLIIIGTLFAITAGFDSNQIAPAMGLFGTIAGYLLGKRAPSQTSAPEEEEK
jgi:hypothetical protein